MWVPIVYIPNYIFIFIRAEFFILIQGYNVVIGLCISKVMKWRTYC